MSNPSLQEEVSLQEPQASTPKKTRKGGMPKGHKTKKTLIKEEVQNLSVQVFKDQMIQKTGNILEAVYEKAVEGDMSAAKIWLDRVMPTTKAIDPDANNGDLQINIQVNTYEREENA